MGGVTDLDIVPKNGGDVCVERMAFDDRALDVTDTEEAVKLCAFEDE